MNGITDMHCHILPGLDDGSLSMEETLATLHSAEKQNITRMIVTPHFHPERYIVEAPQIYEGLEAVRKACDAEGIHIQLFPGQECYYYSGLVSHLDEGKALTLCGTRFVLVEFDPGVSYSYLKNGIQTLRQNGYVPIIAHFERYECLLDDNHLNELKSQQYLLQMNYDLLLIRGGLLGDSRWQKLLKKGYVDFLGSDCHGTHFRPLHVDKAVHWMEKKVEPELVKRMLQRNFDRLVYG
ncbi:MAG: protein tyrosine phosphatase [Blautia sp.]|nr:protein tyrosine phosphatase [Blautia sp.]